MSSLWGVPFMARHADGIGYLLEVRQNLGMNWFSCVCDYAIASTGTPIGPEDIERLFRLFTTAEAYTPVAAPQPPTQQSQPSRTAGQPHWLVELGGFKNFKKLAETLTLNLTKRITIIFGTNAAGKSSLCDAIKTLASADQPASPLRNVLTNSSSQPEFSYRFLPDHTSRQWLASHGHGAFADRIKYFDTSIAVKHMSMPPSPENVVEIAPFRLEVFAYAGNIVRQFKTAIDAKQASGASRLQGAMAQIQQEFRAVDPVGQYVTAQLTLDNGPEFERAVNEFQRVTEAERQQHRANVENLRQIDLAGTEQGVRLLQSEMTALTSFQRMISDFVSLCNRVSVVTAQAKAADLNKKRVVQAELARDILPTGTNVELFKRFIAFASPLIPLDNPSGRACPFCRQELSPDSIALIKKYHAFLTNLLEEDIQSLMGDITGMLAVLE
jgi:hypothetical protein